MVTDATGEGIHSVADLVHEDNIIVHAGSVAGGNMTYDAAAAAAAATAAGTGPGDLASLPAGAVPPGNAATSALLHPDAPICPARHPDYRIAILIPLLGPAPAYLPYFVASATRSSPLIDW